MGVQVIPFILGALFAFAAIPAVAENDSFQQQIFSNCEEAQRTFAQYEREKQRSLLEYLLRVVALNTQAPAAPEAFAVMPGGKAGESLPSAGQKNLDLSAPALWQTTDAKRELRAKRCALDVLTSTGALGFAILPNMVTLYSEQPLSDEVAVGVEETAASIAEQAHRNGQTLSEEEIDRLAPFIQSERSLVVRNLFHEYVAIALPRILTYLSKLQSSDAPKVVSFLRELDPDGGRSMRVFVDLIAKLPAENSNRLAGYLPFPTKEATAPLLSDFARLASDNSQGPEILRLVGRGCLMFKGVIIDPVLSATLARNPSLLEENKIPLEEQRCLVSSISTLAQLVPTMLLSAHEHERAQAFRLLAAAYPSLDTARRTVVFTKVKDLVGDAKAPLHSEAITALPIFTDRRADAIGLATGIIKTSQKADSSSALAWQALSEMTPSKDTQKVLPALSQALAREHLPEAAIEVAGTIDALEPSLVKLASNRSPSIASSALYALGKRTSLAKTTYPAVIEALRVPASARAAESALLIHGSSALPLIRKALLKTSGTNRTGLLVVLQHFGAATKSESTELASTLASSEGCDGLKGRAQALASLENVELEKSLSAKFSTKLTTCLCALPDVEVQTILATAASRVFSSPDRVGEIQTHPTSCNHLFDSFAGLLTNEAVPANARAALAREVLGQGSPAQQISLLNSLKTPSDVTAQLAPTIRTLASASDATETRYQAAHALARLADSEYDWKHFVRSVIDLPETAPYRSIALDTVRALPASVVLEEVSPALDSESSARVAGACRVGAALGPLAIPIVSKVWNLREKRAPEVRYAAILALLEINPLTPDLHMALRSLLVNRYYQSASDRPIQWGQCVAVVDLDKSSFGTLRTVHLERLLSKR
jgi:hypothetical protein